MPGEARRWYGPCSPKSPQMDIRHSRASDQRVSPEFKLEGAQVRCAFDLNGHGKLIPDLHRVGWSDNAHKHGGGCSRMALRCRHCQENRD